MENLTIKIIKIITVYDSKTGVNQKTGKKWEMFSWLCTAECQGKEADIIVKTMSKEIAGKFEAEKIYTVKKDEYKGNITYLIEPEKIEKKQQYYSKKERYELGKMSKKEYLEFVDSVFEFCIKKLEKHQDLKTAEFFISFFDKVMGCSSVMIDANKTEQNLKEDKAPY